MAVLTSGVRRVTTARDIIAVHERAAGNTPSQAAGGDAVAGEQQSDGQGQDKRDNGQERHRHGRRDRHRDFRKPRPDQPAAGAVAADAAAAPAPVAQEGKHEDGNGRPRERLDGKGRNEGRNEDRNRGKSRDRDDAPREGGRDKGRGRDRGRESGPSHRQYASSASPRERDRPIDPNSPFAKLAALKEQMTAGRKD